MSARGEQKCTECKQNIPQAKNYTTSRNEELHGAKDKYHSHNTQKEI